MLWTVKNKFKMLFIAGLILSFISLFLDWYSFQVFDKDQNLIASWSYNPFTEWTTIFPEGATFNKLVRPDNLFIPIAINIIFIVTILASAYGILFHDLENEKSLEKQYPYAYINFFLLFINGFYLFVFPIMYLIPNDLYFPYLIYEDLEYNLSFYYCIGPGYILQIFSFLLIFPYCIFYYQTIVKFETKEHSPAKVIDRYIQKIQEPLDLDKFIAEEELALKFENFDNDEFSKHEINQILKGRVEW